MLVVGTQAVRESARHGRLGVMVIARDAGENARDRVVPLAAAAGVPRVECGTADSLGRALGRGRTVVAGVEDPRLARRIRELVERATDGVNGEGRNEERGD